MAVFRAYYDASGVETQNGHLVVVGVIATEARWKKYEQRWNAVLSEYHLTHHHHKDYAHSKNEYARWKGDEVKRKEYLRRMIAALHFGMNKGLVVMIPNSAIKAVNDRYIWGKGDGSGAYLLAADTCRKGVEDFVHNSHPGDELVHVFEKGDKGQDWLPDLLRIGGGRNNGWAILPKKDDAGRRIRQFEAADLVAWEMKRLMDDRAEGRQRPIRGALRELSHVLPIKAKEIDAQVMLRICDDAPPGMFQVRP
jgi:hypothetical protein